MVAPCAGDAPVSWVNRSTCSGGGTSQPACGRGDLLYALKDSYIPVCGPREDSLRHFNRSMKLSCFQQLAQRRDQHLARLGMERNGSSCTTYENGTRQCAYRLLVVGNSNAGHMWHSFGKDDINRMWDVAPDFRRRHPNCLPIPPDGRLRSFLPHAHVDYNIWQVVSPLHSLRELRQNSGASCWAPHGMAVGGLGLRWLVRRVTEPYDVLVIHVGMWEASFTNRNITAFEHGLELSVAAAIDAWPGVRIVLVACTPCSGVNGNDPPRTPDAGCDFVGLMNDASRRVASAQRR